MDIMRLLTMSGLRFSFSKSLVITMALASISASCLSSVAFAMEPDEDNPPSVSAVPSSKDLPDIVFPLEDNPTIINLILGFLDPQSLLYMGTTNKYFHQICNSPDLWDALFKRDLYPHPSFSLASLLLKSPSNYYGLAYFVQEVLLPSAIRQRAGSKISKPIRGWWEEMISQAFPKNSSQGNYLLGLVYEDFCLNQEAFNAYKKAADAGCVKAQSKVAKALYKGKLDQGGSPVQERLTELQTRAAEGDQHAQKQVNKALFLSILGQDGHFDQERLDELKTCAAVAGQEAQAQVRTNDALYVESLGQGICSEEEGLEELISHMKRDLNINLISLNRDTSYNTFIRPILKFLRKWK